MLKTIVKYPIIFIMLLIYINRGIFISPYEIENHGNIETNSVIEWIIQFVTGESNDIDEDGDLQTDCNSVKIVSTNFCQEFAQYLDMLNLYSNSMEKLSFPNKENLNLNDFYTPIDHPPQIV